MLYSKILRSMGIIFILLFGLFSKAFANSDANYIYNFTPYDLTFRVGSLGIQYGNLDCVGATKLNGNLVLHSGQNCYITYTTTHTAAAGSIQFWYGSYPECDVSYNNNAAKSTGDNTGGLFFAYMSNCAPPSNSNVILTSGGYDGDIIVGITSNKK